MFIYFNPNPLGRLNAGDCVVRALCALFDNSWDEVYTNLCLTGYQLCLMPTHNAVHQEYLKQRGYTLYSLPSNCPECINVKEFAKLYPKGNYILAMGDHVVALKDGNFYDVFDSSNEVVSYFFKKKGE